MILRNFNNIILPSLPNQDFFVTSSGKIDKVPCEGIYDESNSLFATQVDAWTDLFIASALARTVHTMIGMTMEIVILKQLLQDL